VRSSGAGTIKIVGDDDMPEGHDFVLVADEDGGDACLFYRASALTARTLERSWTAYRRLLGVEQDPPGDALAG